MSENFSREPMLDLYIFETIQMLEQLEQILLSCEKFNNYPPDTVNEIFRLMHTIKGSSAMMFFDSISSLAHSVEDLFYFIRETKPKKMDFARLTDAILQSVDFIKKQISKIEDGKAPDGDPSTISSNILQILSELKAKTKTKAPEAIATKPVDEDQKYYVSNSSSTRKINSFEIFIRFEEGCEMENIRAFTVVHNIKEFASEIHHIPTDIIESDSSVDVIRQDGFFLYLKTESTYEEINTILIQTLFLKELEIKIIEDETIFSEFKNKKRIDLDESTVAEPKIVLQEKELEAESQLKQIHQSIISVNVKKLDKLMDLVGELVISEAMVAQNPDLAGLKLNNFQKAARQLRKITTELQDTVMSIRMVPLAATFQKMNRIVRDTSKKLNKDIVLELMGEETEVDKNIIENISDPLMHLIRNSIDHGIEDSKERIAVGKHENGKISLEAKNIGSEVVIIVKDDGKGLNKDKILQKAFANGLIAATQNELSEEEIFSFILLPGFSTKEQVTEMSGRGVGMDVVTKNIEKLGGTIQINSKVGIGTEITLKIPLTLAIIDGMNIKVGNLDYTIPTASIKESFRAKESDVIKDPDGNEMILKKGACYPVVRIHERFKVSTKVTNIPDGIIVMVENSSKGCCIFADELIGEQQVVVKALPGYVKKINGVAGCTLLGNGSISLILDIDNILNKR